MWFGKTPCSEVHKLADVAVREIGIVSARQHARWQVIFKLRQVAFAPQYCHCASKRHNPTCEKSCRDHRNTHYSWTTNRNLNNQVLELAYLHARQHRHPSPRLNINDAGSIELANSPVVQVTGRGTDNSLAPHTYLNASLPT